jgi:hypothetical protein
LGEYLSQIIKYYVLYYCLFSAKSEPIFAHSKLV